MKGFPALVVMFAVGALVGCGSSAPTAPPTAALSPLLPQLDGGQAMWRKANINNYRIVVAEVISRFAPVSQAVTVTVRNGQVTDQSLVCRSGPCDSTFKAEDYTVPALFARARGDATNPKLATQLSLDPTYGFPAYIASSVPQQTESSGSLRVEQFQPLP